MSERFSEKSIHKFSDSDYSLKKYEQKISK